MINLNNFYKSKNIDLYINDVLKSGNISGDKKYTKLCSYYLKNKYNFNSILTTSCTHALELIALAINIKPGDEIICPSYTYVSTINSFVLRGAIPIFIDSLPNNPNIDHNKIEEKITEKTKCIIIVHYGGISCNMNEIIKIKKKHKIFLIEDSAHSLGSTYNNIYLGSFGDFSTFSFHETKNLSCGEGGLLVVNNLEYIDKCIIIKNKGTNYHNFIEKKINKYEWVDVGSSYSLSDINAAILLSQLEDYDLILDKRYKIWNAYYLTLLNYVDILNINIPSIDKNIKHNSHIFYIIFNNQSEFKQFYDHMKKNNINVSTHYICLHKSHYYVSNYKKCILPNSEKIEKCLIRFPIYVNMTDSELKYILDTIKVFINNKIIETKY